MTNGNENENGGPYDAMLDAVRGTELRHGVGVLTAGEIDPAIPMIHDVGTRDGHRLRATGEVVHCGFGFFKGSTSAGEFSFDGGGAMNELPAPGCGWTVLRADPGVLDELGYDMDAVRAALERLAAGA